MIIQLLGTGSAGGWPNAFCRCQSCATERVAGRTRNPSAVLIDEVVLVDIGPTVTAAATRFGTSLAGVQHLLITHGHPDHLAPEFLLARGWVAPELTLHIWAPPEAISRCLDWVGPDDAIEFHPIAAGAQLKLTTELGDYHVKVLPANHANGNGDVLTEEAVLFDITAPDKQCLLYATDTGPFSEELVAGVRGRNFDVVLLDETFGTKYEHVHGHLDLATFPTAVNTLRDVKAICDTSAVIAIHLSHHNPPTAQLCELLAECGARVVDDGTTIEVGATPMIKRHHFVLGGARSGKSKYAETLATRYRSVTYIATGYPAGSDPNWNARLILHRQRRPAPWQTIETIDLVSVLAGAPPNSCLLIDCLALWLTRTLDELDGWSTDPQVTQVAQKEVALRTEHLLTALDQTNAEVILVSNEVGQSVVPETSSGRLFRDLLGIVNAKVAQNCLHSTFMIAGHSLPLDRIGIVRG